MAWLPIEDIKSYPDPFFIPTSVCKLVLASKLDQVEIDLTAKELHLKNSKFYCQQETFQTQLREVTASHITGSSILLKLKESPLIAFNPYLLVRLAKALGIKDKPREPALVLQYTGPTSPIRFIKDERLTGLIMPMRLK